MFTGVVIPCYNNQSTVGSIVRECLRYIETVIVVDDGSTDLSAIYAKEAGAKVISIGENRGVGYATGYGINVAQEIGCKTIVTLDSDGAHDPSDIPQILTNHNINSNILTIGDRWSRIDNNYTPSMKLWANEFATHLVNCSVNLNLSDVACGFRVLSEHMMHKLPEGSGFDFLYEMIFLARTLGRIGNAPVRVRYDANTLWITKHAELLNFLKACRNGASEVVVKGQILTMENYVENWKMLRVKISSSSHKHDILIAHPLKEYDGYIFQKQYPAFYDSSSLELVEI